MAEIYSQFPPPKALHILSTVQIMFVHSPSNHHMMCKVDISRLNKKLQKLQNEGMKIVGLFFVDLEKEPHAYTQPPIEGGD